MNVHDQRVLLLDIFKSSLNSVSGRPAVKHYLDRHPISGRPHIVAVGKAACAMAAGALDVLGEEAGEVLVITKKGHLESVCSHDNVTCLEAEHPVPDQTSLIAGRRLCEFLQQRVSGPFLFLISGGASSLVEVLPESVELEQLDELTSWLLASGMPIQEMNRYRRVLSCIKGGKLLGEVADDAQVEVLLISDVMGDSLEAIGSGLCFPVHDEVNVQRFPESIRSWWQACQQQVPDRQVPHHIVASLQQAMDCARDRAVDTGLSVFVHQELLTGDAATEGEHIARQLIDELEPGIHIWGGETTVQLPERPGRGGRNQHLALSAAQILDGVAGICLLSAGTDGTDGPGSDAGALVDGGTVRRGKNEGLIVQAKLQAADSGSFLEASGDLVSTGPTGTNVMDLVIAIKS
jgi:hydroxypyruvate reductase